MNAQHLKILIEENLEAQNQKISELRSISFAKSASIIWSISTNGWSFSLIRSTSVNSSNFTEYLRELRKFIESYWKI